MLEEPAVGQNPKTGVEVAIAPRTVIVFKASKIVKARVNGMPSGANSSAEARGDL